MRTSRSQACLPKKRIKKTFARMQITQHLNRIPGIPKTMTFEKADADFIEQETKGGTLLLHPTNNLSRSKS